jgi:hypothetical protein
MFAGLNGRSCDASSGRQPERNLVAPFNQEGTTMKKIDINKLPELHTKVGIHGSAKQREVGGPGCGGIIIAIIVS